MSRTDLTDRLDGLTPPAPASAFVLLWTYYASRLAEVENGLRAANVQPLRLDAFPPLSVPLTVQRLRQAIDELKGMVNGDPAQFDSRALGLLKRLDKALFDQNAAKLRSIDPIGCDGKTYRVRRRNSYIYDTMCGHSVAWAADQGGSMAAGADPYG